MKISKNRNITEVLFVSPFLGVNLGVDFEITPKLKSIVYKGFIAIKRSS